ncbi:MAG: hypothetical protein KME26_31620 [Oscillatoria princeps RMCB-10]|jgi:hypothetical protein|nr:hypothetical protein [Oscillatoria princeps RMCB-10]
MIVIAAGTTSQSAATFGPIEVGFFILIFIIPVVAVWRWSLLGVFVGTLSNEVIIIMVSVLSNKLKSQELNYENYEAWLVWAFYMFAYSFLIWIIKCFINLVRLR